MTPGLVRRAHHVVRKERREPWTVTFNLPWRFFCRGCGRSHHHETWRDAILSSMIHRCEPGSPW